jgi:TM2 domain-containing membrane protein YozV
MKRKITSMSILVSFVFMCTAYGAGPSEEDFILHLYSSGSYDSVILETNRYLYFNQGEEFSIYARYLLGLSYAKTGRMRRALTEFEELRNAVEKAGTASTFETVYQDAYIQEMNVCFREKNTQGFWALYHDIDSMDTQPDNRLMMYVESMGTALYIYNLEWKKARDFLNSSRHTGSLDTAYLDETLFALETQKQKSALVGGLLSIVPGFGHFYAGRRSDGFRSMLLNSAFIVMTVASIITGMGIPAVLFGVVEAVLYVSNIYGGINAVMQENARQTLAVRDSLLKMLPVPPFDPITCIGALQPR